MTVALSKFMRQFMKKIDVDVDVDQKNYCDFCCGKAKCSENAVTKFMQRLQDFCQLRWNELRELLFSVLYQFVHKIENLDIFFSRIAENSIPRINNCGDEVLNSSRCAFRPDSIIGNWMCLLNDPQKAHLLKSGCKHFLLGRNILAGVDASTLQRGLLLGSWAQRANNLNEFECRTRYFGVKNSSFKFKFSKELTVLSTTSLMLKINTNKIIFLDVKWLLLERVENGCNELFIQKFVGQKFYALQSQFVLDFKLRFEEFRNIKIRKPSLEIWGLELLLVFSKIKPKSKFKSGARVTECFKLRFGDSEL